jgi:nitrate reductase beta subunit
MKVRSQVSMVFHLDKCIGCHTCSIACKNIWTDRPGAEYMWWNNVETKPGVGFPTQWEDQEKYHGGWELEDKPKNPELKLKLQNRLQTFANLFSNPAMPTMDDYYEPWTYNYGDLFNSPLGPDQPTARPISRIDGKPIDIKAGPNWDDDLGGSNIYAVKDPLLADMNPEDRQRLFSIEQLFYFYMPRICNHCLNAACVGACPSGAIYKRAEDGVVLINQDKCRGWRMCVSACPYKKTYYNWSTGKSEKCILCYPRLETGQAPACFHSCVGRIRYLGVLLYDADQIPDALKVPDEQLVQRQREMILDPFDPKVVAAAKESGIPDGVIAAAQNSPVYQIRQRMGAGSAPASRISHPADVVLRPAASARPQCDSGKRHTARRNGLVHFTGKSPRASPLYVAHAFGWQRRTRYQSLSQDDRCPHLQTT